MSVSHTVKQIAEAIGASGQVEEALHRLQIELLRLMPMYVAADLLVTWETAFQKTLSGPDDDAGVGLLLMEVFDFARCNMYGAFDLECTQRQYAMVHGLLARHGIVIADYADLTDW